MSEPEPANTEYKILDLELSLNYRHGLGALTPFFNALLEGRALASRCPDCGDVRFPPRVICGTNGCATENILLSGEGVLVRFTIGSASALLDENDADMIFGEVALEGSDNRVFARIRPGNQALAPGMRVKLVRPEKEPRHPVQALIFEPVAD